MENEKILVNCIYSAIEGEGVRIGVPQIFIRLQGCSIGCVNCDTKETWSFEEKYFMSLKEIISQVERLKINTISITGGDPLDGRHINAVIKLVRYLKPLNYFINIEASGLKISNELFDLVDFISFDYKTLSTGVKTPVKNLQILSDKYAFKSQVKAVIANHRDFSDVYDCYMVNPNLRNLNWVLTPCFEPGSQFPTGLIKDITKWMLDLNVPFRMILQQHKIIYGPDERMV